MEKRIYELVDEVFKVVNKKDKEQAKKKLAYFQRWLAYFQHERLVHLIVTHLFALMTILSLITFFVSQSFAMILILVIFAITTFAYVKHYYVLENKVQLLYTLIDKVIELCES